MTLPMTTLPIVAASSPERLSVSRTTVAPRSVAGIVLREPLKVPIAVRTGLQRTTSCVLMGLLLPERASHRVSPAAAAKFADRHDRRSSLDWRTSVCADISAYTPLSSE